MSSFSFLCSIVPIPLRITVSALDRWDRGNTNVLLRRLWTVVERGLPVALIKMGALAQDVRGSLNGSTFSRNRGGAYVRSKVSPVQPVSAYSAAARSAFKAGSQLWATGLTQVQRAGWVAFAAVHPFVNVFGDSITLSGIAMFNAVNQRLQLCGEAVLLDAPSSFVVADLGSVALTKTIVAGVYTVCSLLPARTLLYAEGLYVFWTPGLPPGVKIQKTDYRLVNSAVSGLFTGGESISAFVNGRFAGAPWTTGKQYGIMVAALNAQTGAISSALSYVFQV